MNEIIECLPNKRLTEKQILSLEESNKIDSVSINGFITDSNGNKIPEQFKITIGDTVYVIAGDVLGVELGLENNGWKVINKYTTSNNE